MEKQVCEDCGRELPLSEFPKNGKHKDGSTRYRPDCKICYGLKRNKSTKKRHTKFLNNDKNRTGVEPKLSLMDWAAALAYFGGKCMYCGKPASRRGQLTKEHIIPVSHGGHTEKTNIGPACRACNTSKNNNDMETWYRKQKFFDEERLKRVKAWREGQMDEHSIKLFEENRRKK
jgi:5-methylcytosine-specific restriction endonuclease McrA